jgi:hypothetical protein
MEAALKHNFRERINFRILAFVAFLAVVIGYPVYVFLDTGLSGGIKDIGDGVKRVELKSMSSFVFDQSNGTESDVPPQYRQLSGQTVVLEGEMVPPSMSARGGAAAFELVYSVQKCCFSGAPQIQHFVQCRVPSGHEAPYIPGLVQVKGKLQVKVTRDAETNAINGVYHLDVEEIRPVE